MVLITGSLAYDQIMDFPGKFSDHILPDKIHILNVSFLVDKLRKGYGGTAGNIAYTLSLLGVKTAILGIVGGDFKPYRNFLEKNEVETKLIKTIHHFNTSAAFGITDSTDNQIWGFYTGVDSLSDQLTIDSVKEKIDFAIVAPQNPKAMTKFSHQYTKKEIPYLFDPGMQLPWLSGADLISAFEGAKIIIGNDYEMDVMEKKTNISDIHKKFTDKFVITTLGGKGSQVSFRGKMYKVSSATVKNASDPAGAGDAYRAGYVAGFLRGFPCQICAQMGSVASAYTVEKYGTTTHFYTLLEFQKRYRDNFGEEIKF